jgi:translation initiation factor IF-3
VKQNNTVKNRLSLINEKITFEEIFLITESGEKIGLISRNDALKKTQEMNLNLICLSPHTSPPICKMISDKDIFNILKKKNKPTKQITKEIKVAYHIGKNDLATKIDYIEKKLLKGNTIIKVILEMRGREKQYKELAREKCQKIIDYLHENSGGKIKLMGEVKSQDKNCYFRLFRKSK